MSAGADDSFVPIDDLVDLPDPLVDVNLPPELLDEPQEFDVSRPAFEESDLGKLYQKRREQNRDLVILVSDWNNERGSGKSTLTLKLCDWMDQTEEGFTAAKATVNGPHFMNQYKRLPPKSALALDEAEAGASARDAMTKLNKLLIKLFSMGRVLEKYCVMNMPASGHIDKNLLDLADYWIIVQRRGLARGYRLNKNPFEGRTYPTPTQTITWNSIPKDSHLHKVYESIDSEKRARLDGREAEQSEQYVLESEAEERLERALKEQRRELRDTFIARAIAHPRIDAPQWAIGDAALGVSQGQVYKVTKDMTKWDLSGIPEPEEVDDDDDDSDDSGGDDETDDDG